MSYTIVCNTDSGKLIPVATAPVMVGDTIYTNRCISGWYLRGKEKPYSMRVVFVGLNGDTDGATKGGVFNVEYGEDKGRVMQFTFADVGKYVFTSREEALRDG